MRSPSFVLLTRREAARRLGRSEYTIRDWERMGLLPVARREGRRILYDSRRLLEVARLRRNNYRNRNFIAGTGRGNRHPATAEIERRILAGERTADIAKACQASETTVRRIRRRMD
jgi:DNA-binding transcriptional MerR regulator